MNIALLAKLLHQYFIYIGIEPKFHTNGMFAHIDLQKELEALEPNYIEGSEFKSLIDAIQDWDSKFEPYVMPERALHDLTKQLIKKDISQNVIIKKWKKYAELKGEESPSEIEGGFCAGLSYTSGLELVEELPPAMLPNNLFQFETLLEKIDAWDEKELNPDIDDCFQTLKEFSLPLQTDQFNDFHALSDQIDESYLPPSQLNLSFVHNEKTLKYKFEQILQPGNFVIFGASNHAARAYVTLDGKIIYYNPNEPYGYLYFDLEHIEYFLEKIPSGFKNCYPDRFGLTTIVCPMRGVKKVPGVKEEGNENEFDIGGERKVSHLELEHLFETLIQVGTGGDSTPSRIRSIIDAQDSRGMTALNLTCYADDHKEVLLLLAKNANPNLRDVKRYAPLHYAAMRGNQNNVDALLAIPTLEVNPEATNGYTPFHWAVLSGKPGVVKSFLADQRTRVNFQRVKPKLLATPLHLAVSNNDVEIARLLIAHTDVNLNVCKGEYHLTPLHIAAHDNCKRIAYLLIAQKSRLEIDAISSEVDADFPKGMTALCYAMNESHFDIASALFQAGADITYLPMSLRWQLLDHLLTSKDITVEVEALSKMLESGVLETDENDEDLIELLSNLVENNKTDYLAILFNHDPRLVNVMITGQNSESGDEKETTNDQDKSTESFEYTLLHKAVAYSAVESAQLLIQHNPKLISKRDTTGFTPGDYITPDMPNEKELQELCTRRPKVTPISMFPQPVEDQGRSQPQANASQNNNWRWCTLI